MKMIKLLVANFQSNGKTKFEELEKMIKAQIDNSLEFGWDSKNIYLMTNFMYSHNGIDAYPTNMNDFCLTGSKTFGIYSYFTNPLFNIFPDYYDDTIVWCGDLDLWQNASFNPPEIKDIGISTYSTKELNGGCVFYKKSSLDIIQKVVELIKLGKEKREEPSINKIFKLSEYSERITILNNTFNVGCSGYAKRYDRATKPILCKHFHPTNRIAWETHALNRNYIDSDPGISPELMKTLKKYWPNLPTELSEEGKKRQAEHKAEKENAKTHNT